MRAPGGDTQSASARLRVAALSPPIMLGDTDENITRLADVIGRHCREGAQLVVVPELATSGYMFDDRDEAKRAALSLSDPRWDRISATLPAGAVAVVGFAERDGDSLWNSAAVVTREGCIGRYRKAHLWGRETELFDRGDSAGIAVPTPIGLLGVAICYDNEFPEVPRGLALRGARLLALPVNWPVVPRPRGERPPETIQAMAAARSSRLATVIADRHGSERGVDWTGGTCIIDGDGWVAAASPQGVGAVLTLHGGDKSLPPHNDLFGDRRPDLYS